MKDKRKKAHKSNKSRKVRFSPKDISDAKKLVANFPDAVFVSRGCQNHLILGNKDRAVVTVISPPTDMLPSIKANAGDFRLDDIIAGGAESSMDALKVTTRVQVLKSAAKPRTNMVSVRWFDGYLEEFEATEVRFGSDILFLRLADGKNRHIPLRQVRWFGMAVESHQGEFSKGDHNER